VEEEGNRKLIAIDLNLDVRNLVCFELEGDEIVKGSVSVKKEEEGERWTLIGIEQSFV
jgi:hypothetical protein